MAEAAPIVAHRTKRLACPNPRCTGSVGVLAAPDGFVDRRHTVRLLCQSCGQKFAHPRGRGITDIRCRHCDDVFDSRFGHRAHLIAAHGAPLAAWPGFRPMVDGRRDGRFVCGYPNRDGEPCGQLVGHEWSVCYAHRDVAREVYGPEVPV